MANILKCGKSEWYEAFGLTEGRGEQKCMIFEDAGDDDHPAHLTLFTATWQFMFQLNDGVSEIMDRIFGSGPRAAHITLEDTGEVPKPRIFRGGPRYGTDEQIAIMTPFLEARMAAARERIEQLCADYDCIEWDFSGDGGDVLHAAPGDAFHQMARIASLKNSIEVRFPRQKDSALLLKAVAIHPLQPLQNTYQRLVRDACRGITDEEARKEKEGEQMANYFFFDAASPKPLSPAKDALPDNDELLEQIDKHLQKLEKAMENAEEGDATAAKEMGLRATRIKDGLHTIRGRFENEDVTVECLQRADDLLEDLEQEISAAGTDPDLFSPIHRMLTQAARALTTAHESFCCIQNFHIIEPFYLFRLLVKFQIRSEDEIPSSKRTEVSAMLTGLLHNNKDAGWLFDWLRDKLVQLDKALKKTCGGDAVFFLKGGRAAKYLLKQEKKGENDWDTQIIINPNLRAGQWYGTFVKVHNTVLDFLRMARAEFLIQVTQNADAMMKALPGELAKVADERAKAKEKQDEEALAAMLVPDEDKDGDFDAALAMAADLFQEAEADLHLEEDKNKVNCKAELIDIGIPRRDTAEAFEQWAHVRPHVIQCPDGIPIPGHLYYINEYMMMIREAFAGISISMPKTPKRIVRLMEVLELDDLDGVVAEELEKVPKALLPKSLGAIDGLGSKPVKHILNIMLKQYMEAWDLEIDTGLAAHFDTLFSGNINAMAAKAKYPGALTEAIGKAQAAHAYEAKHKTVADAIGFAQWVAEEFAKHINEDRHAFITQDANSRKFAAFVKSIYTGSFFGKGEDLEVRMAVSGAAAGLMHAAALKLEKDRRSELSPVTRVDLSIYCKSDADPATVLELISPVVEKYLAHPKTPKYKMKAVGEDSLCLYWPEDVAIGQFTYTPLAIRIAAVKRPEDWPMLTFYKGLPVLSLRELVWDYKKLTGDTEENFTHRQRKTATETLVDLLTRYENPDAGAPWVRPGR